MKYLLLLHGGDDGCRALPANELERLHREHAAYEGALRECGALVAAAALESAGRASTLRDLGPTPRWTDGPFAESREQLGGFYLIDVDDEAAARAWAERMPPCEGTSVEVRGVAELA